VGRQSRRRGDRSVSIRRVKLSSVLTDIQIIDAGDRRPKMTDLDGPMSNGRLVIACRDPFRRIPLCIVCFGRNSLGGLCVIFASRGAESHLLTTRVLAVRIWFSNNRAARRPADRRECPLSEPFGKQHLRQSRCCPTCGRRPLRWCRGKQLKRQFASIVC
jgi:hypothetical protein